MSTHNHFFDFNQHIQNYSDRFFFNQLTYHNLSTDLYAFADAIKNIPDQTIALKLKSPYLAMVAILGCLKEKKLAVLISALETDSGILKRHEQIDFKTIIDDSFFENLSNSSSTESFQINYDQAAVVVFSSGTTAAPKGVVLSFSNLFYSARGFAEFFHQTKEDSSYINLPHHHVGGLMILWRAFFSGGKVTTNINEKIDFLSLVPLQLKRWLSDSRVVILKKVRVILIGGAPLDQLLIKESQQHNLKLFETYGMTETASLVMVNGEVLPSRELQLNSDNLFEVRGETRAIGFYQNQKFTPLSKELWLTTNDRGKKKSDGKFSFTERADLIFISAGENINPLYVEEITKQHPRIKDAYLIPLDHYEWGKMGVMLFDSHDNLSADELKIYLKKSLHPHLVPKVLIPTKIQFEGQLKIKRSELTKVALELYSQSQFSFDYFEIPNAPLIVAFHGFLGDKKDLQHLFTPFEKTHSRLFIDLPGHGQTPIENFSSTEDIMIKLTNLIKSFSSNDPIFYGYSMGGRIALHLALHYLTPAQCFLESAGLGLENLEEQEKRKTHDLALFSNFNQESIKDFIDHWYQQPMFQAFYKHPNYEKECQKKLVHDYRQWRDSQKYLSAGSLPLLKNNLEALTQSNFPLTYFYGEQDLKYQAVARLLKTTSTKAISNAGHNPHKTHPTDIARGLIDLLK